MSEPLSDKELKEFWKGILSGVIIGILLTMWCVVLPFTSPESEVTDLKQQAVERGCAEWRLTHAHNGTTEFKWLDEPRPVSKPVVAEKP